MEIKRKVIRVSLQQKLILFLIHYKKNRKKLK